MDPLFLHFSQFGLGSPLSIRIFCNCWVHRLENQLSHCFGCCYFHAVKLNNMKQAITRQFVFFVFFAFLLVAAESCSKDDNEGKINREIFFEVNFGNDSLVTNYGPLPYGRRPESIVSAGIGAKEIVDADGKVFTTIGVSVHTDEYGPQRITLGKISALLHLIKPGKGIEGTYETYIDPVMIQWNIFAPNQIAGYLVDEPGFTILKTGVSEISGSYAEGFYTFLGKAMYEPGVEKNISGKFRLYLSIK